MNINKQQDTIPDFTFEDKFYLENPFDNRVELKKKKYMIYSLETELKNSCKDSNDRGNHIFQCMLNKRTSALMRGYTISSIKLNMSSYCNLRDSDHISCIDMVTERKILQSGLFAYIFGIPIYANKNFNDEIIIEWSENEL